MEKKNDKQVNETCALCGRVAMGKYGARSLSTGLEGQSKVRLKDGNLLCGECVRKIRIMYPVRYEFDEVKKEAVAEDPVYELTIDEAASAREQAVDSLVEAMLDLRSMLQKRLG